MKIKKGMLVIYPNSKGYGFIYAKDVLAPECFGLTPVQPTSNKRALEKIKVDIELYEPELVVLENVKVNKSKKGSRVKRLISSTKKYCQKKNIKIASYSRQDIHTAFKKHKAKSKHEIALEICLGVPVLDAYKPKKREIWEAEPYHMGIFDAMALLLTHLHFTD